MSGLSNADYASWMSGVAAQDCSEVSELYIKLSGGGDNTYTQTSQICQLMQNATEEQVAGYDEVRFSGVDGDEEPWNAKDERIDINLERTVNFGSVPIKIRRPTGT